MRQRFNMQDYCIEVDYGFHVIERLHTRFSNLDTAYLDFIIENVFTNEKVSDYLINDVRIGDDVVVIDEDSGVSLAVNIGLDCFYVKTIFNAYEGNLLIGDMQTVLRYAREIGLRIEQFQRRRSEVYA